MPRALNTSHPLYSNLVCLIGVEDDGVTLKDFVTPSRVLTPDTSTPNPASFGTGTYGAHFTTGGTTYTPRGASVSPAIPGQTGAASVFIVHNGVTRYDSDSNGTSRQSYWLGSSSSGMDARPNALGIYGVVSAGGAVGAFTGDPGGGVNYNAIGTTSFQGATARSLCATRDNAATRRLRVYVNGTQENENTTAGPNGGTADARNKIGGGDGSVGSLGANLVWYVEFNKELTAAEVASLHSSLGASNVFGLFEAPPAGPTITSQPSNTAVNEPAAASFSVTATGTGALTYQWQRANPGSGTFTNVSGATSATISINPTSTAADHGAQYRCNVTDTTGTTTSSAATLTVRSTTTAARPNADVSAGGWTPSTGAVLWDMIDEAVASDADYIQSPAITASPVPAVMALQYPLAAGTWNIGIRARCTGSSATMRVKLLDAAGTVVGTSPDQAITGTYTTYSLSITTTGVAARVSVEVVT